MIIGHGDIAKALVEVDREDLLFFASGVSNSQETKEEEYSREESLLLKQNFKRHIVYFSSLCVFYQDFKKVRYARHKLHMESLIKMRFMNYTIIRLGNITWGSNPHTIINYIRNKIKLREKFEIRDEYRYIVSKDEFLHWIRQIPEFNCEINIPGETLKVEEIVKKYGYA